MRSLFISPHSDDVCLSLAGLSSRVGDCKHLATVFSTSAWTEPGWQGSASAVTATRTTEDHLFCTRFGFRYHGLGLADSSVRHDGEGDLRVPSGEERDLEEEALQSLLALAHEHHIEALVGPLGIGQHTDHLVCARVTSRLARQFGLPVSFYEDLPYANEESLLRIALLARRRHPGLVPVTCKTRVRMGQKLAAAEIYESQHNDVILDAVESHSERLAARLGITERGVARTEVIERVWSSAGVSLVDRLCTAPVDVVVSKGFGLIGRARGVATTIGLARQGSSLGRPV